MENVDLLVNMKNKLKELSIAPIYFIGSGLSRRYINSPDWKGLLEEIRNDWDREFNYYYQEYVEESGECNYELLASKLEEMYYVKIADSELIEGKNKRFYFRKRISEILNRYLAAKKEELEANQEIQELKKTSPSAIITTNYDELIENIFPQYTSYIGQISLLSNVLDGVGEIYKIHGCVTKPETIIINQKDYDDFFKKSLYLNAKLLTLFLEYPIVFLGYSLTDRNVKSVLSAIVEMLPEEKVEELSKRI